MYQPLPSLNIDSLKAWHSFSLLLKDSSWVCWTPAIRRFIRGVALRQPCRYQFTAAPVYAVDKDKTGPVSCRMPLSKQGDRYRHIMQPVCQSVRCTAKAHQNNLSCMSIHQRICQSFSLHPSSFECILSLLFRGVFLPHDDNPSSVGGGSNIVYACRIRSMYASTLHVCEFVNDWRKGWLIHKGGKGQPFHLAEIDNNLSETVSVTTVISVWRYS